MNGAVDKHFVLCISSCIISSLPPLANKSLYFIRFRKKKSFLLKYSNLGRVNVRKSTTFLCVEDLCRKNIGDKISDKAPIKKKTNWESIDKTKTYKCKEVLYIFFFVKHLQIKQKDYPPQPPATAQPPFQKKGKIFFKKGRWMDAWFQGFVCKKIKIKNRIGNWFAVVLENKLFLTKPIFLISRMGRENVFKTKNWFKISIINKHTL